MHNSGFRLHQCDNSKGARCTVDSGGTTLAQKEASRRLQGQRGGASSVTELAQYRARHRPQCAPDL